MRRLAVLAVALASLTPAANAEEMQEALGGYVTVYVDNFDGTNYANGVTSRDVCLPKATQMVLQFQKEGGKVETVFRNEFLALYKVVTSNNQKLFVHCNQNGSLVIGWKADADVNQFVDASRAIGITLQEKAIDAQAQPAPTNNNVNINTQQK